VKATSITSARRKPPSRSDRRRLRNGRRRYRHRPRKHSRRAAPRASSAIELRLRCATDVVSTCTNCTIGAECMERNAWFGRRRIHTAAPRYCQLFPPHARARYVDRRATSPPSALRNDRWRQTFGGRRGLRFGRATARRRIKRRRCIWPPGAFVPSPILLTKYRRF
jgi:hypothetical protein